MKASIQGALLAFAALWAVCAQASLVKAKQIEQPPWQTECIGYHTMQVPGMVNYAAIAPEHMMPFNPYWELPSSRAPAWGMDVIPDPSVLDKGDWDKRLIYLSKPTTPDALKAIMDKLNARQEHEKQIILEDAAQWQADKKGDPVGEYAEHLRQKAAALRFYKPVPGIQAIADDDGKRTHFYVLLDNQRIVQGLLPSQAAPAKAIEGFLQHYSTREPFSVPDKPGYCLPYAFYQNGKEMAYNSITFSVSEHPEIVINLFAGDGSDGGSPPKESIISVLRNELADVEEVLPLDGRINPSHAVTIDGQVGLEHFALVRRKASKPGSKDALDNPYTKDRSDWVYVAATPGIAGSKPGESFNVVIRIERFGRFAPESPGKQMTEKQFRDFAKRMVEGIHRRPGAWAVK
jgi:hypothetical protein